MVFLNGMLMELIWILYGFFLYGIYGIDMDFIWFFLYGIYGIDMDFICFFVWNLWN